MRRRLPFSPWHLLLMPLALLFVLPLVQMVLTSFMATAEINQFPPKLIPTSLHLEGYRHLFSETKALRWLVNFSRQRREKTMVERLMNELLDASNGLGASVKRREDTHKMAESNKAFAHYRW